MSVTPDRGYDHEHLQDCGTTSPGLESGTAQAVIYSLAEADGQGCSEREALLQQPGHLERGTTALGAWGRAAGPEEVHPAETQRGPPSEHGVQRPRPWAMGRGQQEDPPGEPWTGGSWEEPWESWAGAWGAPQGGCGLQGPQGTPSGCWCGGGAQYEYPECAEYVECPEYGEYAEYTEYVAPPYCEPPWAGKGPHQHTGFKGAPAFGQQALGGSSIGENHGGLYPGKGSWYAHGTQASFCGKSGCKGGDVSYSQWGGAHGSYRQDDQEQSSRNLPNKGVRPWGGPSYGKASGVGKGTPGKGKAVCKGSPSGHAATGPPLNENQRCDLFVGRLAESATESTLRSIFSSVGLEIRTMKIPNDQQQQPKGFAFVSLADPSKTAFAIERLQGYEVNGRAINIEFSEPMSGAVADKGSGKGSVEPWASPGGGAHKGGGGRGKGGPGDWSQSYSKGERGWSALDWGGHEDGWLPRGGSGPWGDEVAGDEKGRRAGKGQRAGCGWSADDGARAAGAWDWDAPGYGRGADRSRAQEWSAGGARPGSAWEGGHGHWVPKSAAPRRPEGREGQEGREGRAAARGGPGKVFVTNLAVDAGEKDVRKALGAARGLTGVRLLAGRASSIAFLDFRDEEGAEAAVAGLQGAMVRGRPAVLAQRAGASGDDVCWHGGSAGNAGARVGRVPPDSESGDPSTAEYAIACSDGSTHGAHEIGGDVSSFPHREVAGADIAGGIPQELDHVNAGKQ